MTLTGINRYHEDYAAGSIIVHRRGHTVCTADNQMLSLLTMNTAQTHFNEHSLASYMDGAFDAPLLNACVALALTVGLTSEDMSENSLGDLGYARFEMPSPLVVGDTLYATSEVLDTDKPSGREDAGVLRYRITGRTPDGRDVVHVERQVLLKKRTHWLERDVQLAQRLTADIRARLAAPGQPASAPPIEKTSTTGAQP